MARDVPQACGGVVWSRNALRGAPCGHGEKARQGMSLLEQLREQGDKAIERITPEKVSDLLTKMEAKIPPPSDNAWQSQIRGMSLDALHKLTAHSDALAGHTRE